MSADIDIDLANRNEILNKIEHRIAIIDHDKKHNTGVYVTEIPHNPINNYATINYKEADNRGYFKLDFLNVSIYKDVIDENHLCELMNREPIWDLLLYDDFTNNVFHLNNHGDVLRTLKPQSIEQLAAVLAIIRPAKRHLVNESWETIMNEVWEKPKDDVYYFKKSHAISYAVACVVHINLLTEKLYAQSN